MPILVWRWTWSFKVPFTLRILSAVRVSSIDPDFSSRSLFPLWRLDQKFIGRPSWSAEWHCFRAATCGYVDGINCAWNAITNLNYCLNLRNPDCSSYLHRNYSRSSGGKYPRNMGHEQNRRGMGIWWKKRWFTQNPSLLDSVWTIAASWETLRHSTGFANTQVDNNNNFVKINCLLY